MVLLRKHDKYQIWLSVGGHVELDEDPNQAAVREVKEEVGLDIELYDNGIHPTAFTETYTELIPPVFMNRHRINPTHEHISMTYFARTKTDKLMLSETEKTDNCRWFTSEDIKLATDINSDIKHYALKALETLKE
jgi:8-oxo-dGTP pyrophosphatase MutT (NUDIX family)